ncbi:MAG: glycosyltransferase family 39 protein [Candidatus Acidulodesulfobacterium sp.]
MSSFLSRYKYEIYLAAISVFAFIVHIHLASTLNLGNDEAHYYVWSLKPSLGYLDDAPLVGWVICLTDSLFGKSQLSVRLGSIIFSFFDGFLIYYLTYILFKSRRAAFFSFLFYLSAVIFGMVLSVMMLPDAPLLFFTLLFLIVFYKTLENNKPYFWIISGIFLGLAFLSKYTAALIPPSALLYLIFSKRNRHYLKTVYPYAVLAVALLVFSPVIYWNAVHNFISFRFQLSHGFSHPTPGIPLLLAGWLGQVLVITPFIYIFLIASFIYAIEKISAKKEPEPMLFALCFSFPILLFFVLNGYSHRILVHWPDIGYLAAFPVMGFAADALISGKKFIKIMRYYVYFAIFFGFFLSYVLYNQIYYNSIPVGKIIRYIDKEKRLKKGGIFSIIPHIPGKPSTADITNDLFGWKHAAKYIGIVYNGYKSAYPPLFILTHHYAIADELIYYGGYKPGVNIYNISGFINQYDLWQNLNKINGKNALFVMDDKYMINPVKTYAPYFKSIKQIGRLDIYIKFKPVRIYYLYLMKDFNAPKAIKHLKEKSRMY